MNLDMDRSYGMLQAVYGVFNIVKILWAGELLLKVGGGTYDLLS